MTSRNILDSSLIFNCQNFNSSKSKKKVNCYFFFYYFSQTFFFLFGLFLTLNLSQQLIYKYGNIYIVRMYQLWYLEGVPLAHGTCIPMPNIILYLSYSSTPFSPWPTTNWQSVAHFQNTPCFEIDTLARSPNAPPTRIAEQWSSMCPKKEPQN